MPTATVPDQTALTGARTKLDAWVRELMHRLNLGPIPTTQIGWDQPHEGNLFDHLYARRAIQRLA